MILKVAVTDTGPQPGWLWIDRIAEAQSYGQLCVAADDPLSWTSQVEDRTVAPDRDLAMFSTHSELARVVDAMWGPASVRQFSKEIWPEFFVGPAYRPSTPTTITCVRLLRRDGSAVLLLTAAEAFLLDDSGDTIERLR